MKRIIYIAPFVKKRYKGGIMRIAEYLNNLESNKLFSNCNIELEFFNSHILSQSKNSDGKFTLENVKQALFFLFNLSKRIIKGNYDYIHVNSSKGIPLLKDQIIIFLISLLTQKKIFFQIHYSGIPETFLNNSLLKYLQLKLLRKNYKIIILSENFKNQLISIGFPNEQLIVLHNFHIYKHSIPIIFDPKNTIELIFIGSICERKGFSDIINALIGIGINYNFTVLGEFSSPEIENEYRTKIKNHNIKVNFTGYVEGNLKSELLNKADLLLLPSYEEGFPMVIPEAMAHGCAIISTNIAAIPEIVIDEYNGFLIDPGQPIKIREKIQFLNSNRQLLIKYKNNSFNLSSKYNLENYIYKLSKIYY